MLKQQSKGALDGPITVSSLPHRVHYGKSHVGIKQARIIVIAVTLGLGIAICGSSRGSEKSSSFTNQVHLGSLGR
jgi:hypothetical protein